MRYWKFIAIGLAFGLLIYYIAFYDDGQKEAQMDKELAAVTTEWETKTDEQPPVLIKVTPTQLGPGQSSWKFEVTFTTHSGDLDIGVADAVTLVDDKGNSFRPVSWEGPGPGGHHISGSLIFDPLTPLPGYVELVIKDIGGISRRSFRWEIQ